MQLHRKYQGDGLVVMSLDVESADWTEKDKVLKFLTEKGADFPNYLLQDKAIVAEAWLDKHDAVPNPALVVFDRTGKQVPVPSLDDDKVEDLVKKLLAAK